MLQIKVANVSEVKAAGLPACKAPPVLADSGPVAGRYCRLFSAIHHPPLPPGGGHLAIREGLE